MYPHYSQAYPQYSQTYPQYTQSYHQYSQTYPQYSQQCHYCGSLTDPGNYCIRCGAILQPGAHMPSYPQTYPGGLALPPTTMQPFQAMPPFPNVLSPPMLPSGQPVGFGQSPGMQSFGSPWPSQTGYPISSPQQAPPPYVHRRMRGGV